MMIPCSTLLLFVAWTPLAHLLLDDGSCESPTTTTTATMTSTRRASSSSSSSSSSWNRELSPRSNWDASLPITRPLKLICLVHPDDPSNDPLLKLPLLPDGVEILATASDISDLENVSQWQQANGLFVAGKHADLLAHLIESLPNLQWIHIKFAGIDSLVSKPFQQWQRGMVTNSKGCFSSSLAEYVLMACSYFAKDLPRIQHQTQQRIWDRFVITELRGTTLALIGYGDIGKAIARLAHAYGMRIVAIRRNLPIVPNDDYPYVDEIYSMESINHVFAQSDYIVCTLPLTDETRHSIGAKQFSHAKPTAVFINLGRGPVIDEDALIQALQNQQLKGAALDVFEQEPLPMNSPLWSLPNVLLTPHNMDLTDSFMHEATQFYVHEQIPRFVRNLPLLNVVDPQLGY